ncbi:MAG: spore coat associated protein CotJA [Eubacterium sp.]|mgnify:FL=1|uniref:spore coat associated protein CotJA n=1 Tax=Eubacterium sp. Marseille-QA0814 TaxID=3378778 RepID=UPI002671393D|nr:spore coat associated protein CotJA [uncultured Eubacterium sp.]
MNCTMNRNCNCSGNTMSGCGRSCNMSGGNRPNNMSGFGCSNNATQGCGYSNNTTQSCGPSGNICGCKKAGGCGCMKTDGCDIGTEHVDHMAPGMCYVPWQKWEDIYSPEEGFARGTIFAQLDKSYIGRKCK